MSTEAQRAPVPPRPSTPPPLATAPADRPVNATPPPRPESPQSATPPAPDGREAETAATRETVDSGPAPEGPGTGPVTTRHTPGGIARASATGVRGMRFSDLPKAQTQAPVPALTQEQEQARVPHPAPIPDAEPVPPRSTTTHRPADPAPERPPAPPRPSSAPPATAPTGTPPQAPSAPRTQVPVPAAPPFASPAAPPPVETTARLRPVPPAPRADAPASPGAPARPATPPAATRRRPVGAVELGGPPVRPAAATPYAYRPPHTRPPAETPAETTTRLRPVRTRRPFRAAAAAVCVVLGLGLIGGAATGSWLTSDSSADPAAHSAYTVGRDAWHSVPVDTLFPRTLKGDGAGPGGADRVWTRIAVAPDSGCTDASLDPLLLKTLRPVGCARLLRATYTDATSSSVTTVGLVFTEADTEAMRALSNRFSTEHLDARTDLMPRTYAVKNGPAAGFGDPQRASWTVHALTEVPVVVFAVSGFADGRKVTDPQPAEKAMALNATTAAAQAGLGHEAKGVADRVERGLRRTVADLTEKPE